MKFGSEVLVSNGSMSGSIVSRGVDLQQNWIYSVQAVYTPDVASGGIVSGAGTMKLQVSNDNAQYPTPSPSGVVDPSSRVINWTDYSGSLSSTSSVAGTSSFLWNVVYSGYHWVRFAYTANSGTGVLNVTYFGKGN